MDADDVNVVLNVMTLLALPYIVWMTHQMLKETRQIRRSNSDVAAAFGSTLQQLLRQGDNALVHSDSLAADLAGRDATADAIGEGHPGEAADAAARTQEK